MNESVSFSPWKGPRPPERVLIIRFHAIGDVALVLPAAAWLREQWPGSSIDFLTASPAQQLAAGIPIFDSITTLPPARDRFKRGRVALQTAFAMRRRRYDLIIDLQRNWVSRLIRRAAGAPSWGEFERFAPVPAATGILAALEACGIPGPHHRLPVPLARVNARAAGELLAAHGRDESATLLLVNPAGLWPTRNWPLQNYVEFCRQWREREPAQVLILGTERVTRQAVYIEQSLGTGVINLAGRTSLGQAFAILPRVDLMLTEDSGLMHLAWAAGVPLVALFGSSRHDRSSPQGERALCLHSGDLPCGACMQPSCRFHDVHCLTRHAPGAVLEAAFGLRRRVLSSSPDMH